MKKVSIIFLTIFLFLASFKVNAACEDKDLKDSMDKFEIKIINDSRIDEEKYNYILAFYPYSDKVTVEVKDSDGKSLDVEYNSDLGTYFVGSKYHFEDKKYNIKFFANYASSCDGEILVSQDYVVPKFNEFSLSEYCDNNSNDICSPFYDVKGKTNEELGKMVGINTNEEKKTEKNWLSYWYFILIPVLIISLIYIITINNYKKKVAKR